MGNRLHLALVVTSAKSFVMGASSHTRNIATCWPKSLPFRGVQNDHEKTHSYHFRACGFASARRVNCSWAGTAVQNRALSVDKGREWAAAAAAVTLSKRRELDNNPRGNFADHVAVVKSESPLAGGATGSVHPRSGVALDQELYYFLIRVVTLRLLHRRCARRC